jgi:hypothetical protein
MSRPRAVKKPQWYELSLYAEGGIIITFWWRSKAWHVTEREGQLLARVFYAKTFSTAEKSAFVKKLEPLRRQRNQEYMAQWARRDRAETLIIGGRISGEVWREEYSMESAWRRLTPIEPALPPEVAALVQDCAGEAC